MRIYPSNIAQIKPTVLLLILGLFASTTALDAADAPTPKHPNVLFLLGLARPEKQHFDGLSYAKVLKGEGKLDRPAYFNYFPHGGANKADGVSVHCGDFKLLRWFGNPHTHELYNLREDLSEATDLAAKMPDKAKELTSLRLAPRDALHAGGPPKVIVIKTDDLADFILHL